MKKELEFLLSLKDKASKGVKTVRSGLERINETSKAVRSSLINVQTIMAGLGAGMAIVSMVKDFDNLSTAVGNATDSLKVTGKEAEAVGGMIERVFIAKFDDVGAAADAVTLSFKRFGSEGGAAVESAAIKAKALADRYGGDVSEQIKAASVLQKNFGLTSAEAFDMLAQGYKNGLNDSGDFLASIGEYATQFKNGGATAEEFFSIMQSGYQDGMLGTDKAADAFKEFRLRIQDGSKSTSEALKLIGLDSQQMASDMASGTMTAAQAFQTVIARLQETEDSGKRLQAGAALIGTQFEDLGDSAATAMDMASFKMADAAGAADNLVQKQQTLGTAWKQLVSQISVIKGKFGEVFGPAATGVIETLKAEVQNLMETVQRLKADGTLDAWAAKIKDAVTRIIENFKTMAAVVVNIAEPFAPLLGKLVEFSPVLVTLGAGIVAATTAMNAFITPVTGAMNAFTLLKNSTMAINFIGFIGGIQSASASVGIFTAATATLGTALTTALGAVGAFFAGWQIGKIISASDAFGLMEMSVGDTFQTFIGWLDHLATTAKIKLMEVRQAWNEMTGDQAEAAAIAQAIEGERQHLEQVQMTVAGIMNKATASKTVAASQAADASAVVAAERTVQTAVAETTQKVIEAGNKVQITQQQIAAKRKELAAGKVATETAASEKVKVLSTEELNYIANNYKKLSSKHEEEASKRVEAADTFSDEYIKNLIEADQKLAESQKKNADVYLENLAAQNEAAKAALEEKLVAIQELEAKGVLTVQEAAEQKVQAEAEAAEQRMAAAKEGIEKVAKAYSDDSEQFKKAASEKLTAEKEFYDSKAELAKQESERQKAMADADLALHKAQLEKTLQEIELYEEKGGQSHEVAVIRKREAEKEFYQFKVDSARAAVAEAASQYGKESAQYVKAVADKISAENEFNEKMKESAEAVEKTTEAVRGTTEAVQETAQAAGVAASAFDGMASSASAAKSASEDASTTVLTMTQAMGKSYSELLANPMLKSAAQMLGVLDKYGKMVQTVKKLGGDTSMIKDMPLNQIQEYISSLMTAQKTSNEGMNINFTGTASPKKPLTKTMQDMMSLFDQLKDKATETYGKEINVSQADASKKNWYLSPDSGNDLNGFKAGNNALTTLLDRSAMSLNDSIDYLSTIMSESMEDMKNGVSSASDLSGELYVAQQLMKEMGGVQDMGKLQIGVGSQAGTVIGKSDVLTWLQEALRREKLTA